MKVVLIGTVSSSIFGFRKSLITYLVSSGFEVYILTTDLTPELKYKAWCELGVRAEKYSLARTGVNPVIDLKNAWSLYRRLKKLKPDCVFCYFAKPVIWGALAARFAGVERRYGMLEGLGYYFTDDPGGNSYKKKVLREMQVFLFRLAIPSLSGLVVLNPDDKKDLVDRNNIRQNNVMVLGGIGLDLDEYAYSEVDIRKKRFIFIGRLLAEKGINEYLKAAEIVKKYHPQAEFVVLGLPDVANPGSVNEAFLHRLVNEEVVIYPGSVSNVAEWLASSSVFVLPSYYREGVPRSTQEAMAVGRPIITTDVPGCRETIVDGENGFKVPPHDPQALAEAMRRFINQPDLISSMGRRSRELAVEKFDADRANQRLFCFMKLS